MNYGNLVRRPFEIVARRPYLWILGLLAGGATTFNWSSGSNYRTSGTGPSTQTLQAFWTGNWEWIVTLAGIALAIGIVWFVLGCIATGGIIRAAVEHDDGHDYRFGTAWKAGYSTGWRIAGLRITVFALAIAVAIVIAAPVGATAFFTNTFVPAAVIFALLTAAAGLASVAFFIALGVACEMAERLIVLETGPVFESLAEGFRMVRRHLKELTLGFLIIIAVSIVAGIAMAIVAVLVAVPAGILGFGGWLTGGATGLVVAGSIAAVFFLGVILPLAGAYSAYSSVYWTLVFRSVRAMPAPQTRGAIVPA